VAVICGKTDSYDFYRVAAKAGDKRVVRSFGSYSEAREYADRTVRDLARGSSHSTGRVSLTLFV